MNLIYDFSYQSSDLLRRPQQFGPFSTHNLTILSNVNKRVEDWPNLCGLLIIPELYVHIGYLMFRYLHF